MTSLLEWNRTHFDKLLEIKFDAISLAKLPMQLVFVSCRDSLVRYATRVELRITRESQQTLVAVAGVVDETSDFHEFAKLSGRLRMDMRGVRRFNSFGCRHWMDVIRELSSRATLTFVACSPAVI